MKTTGYFYDRAPVNGDHVRRPATFVDGAWWTPNPTGKGSVQVPVGTEILDYTEEENRERARRDEQNELAAHA